MACSVCSGREIQNVPLRSAQYQAEFPHYIDEEVTRDSMLRTMAQMNGSCNSEPQKVLCDAFDELLKWAVQDAKQEHFANGHLLREDREFKSHLHTMMHNYPITLVSNVATALMACAEPARVAASHAPWLAKTKFMSPELPDATMRFYRRHLHTPALTVPQLLLILTLELWQHHVALYFGRAATERASSVGKYAMLAVQDYSQCINKGLVYRHMEAIMATSLRSPVLLDRALALLNTWLPTNIHAGAAAHHEFSQVLLALCTTLRVNHDYHHPDAVSLRFLATSALQNWIRCPELDVNARAKFEFVNIAKGIAGLLRRYEVPLTMPPLSEQLLLSSNGGNHAAAILPKRSLIAFTIKFSWDIIEACVNNASSQLSKWVLDFKADKPDSGLLSLLDAHTRHIVCEYMRQAPLPAGADDMLQQEHIALVALSKPLTCLLEKAINSLPKAAVKAVLLAADSPGQTLLDALCEVVVSNRHEEIHYAGLLHQLALLLVGLEQVQRIVTPAHVNKLIENVERGLVGAKKRKIGYHNDFFAEARPDKLWSTSMLLLSHILPDNPPPATSEPNPADLLFSSHTRRVIMQCVQRLATDIGKALLFPPGVPMQDSQPAGYSMMFMFSVLKCLPGLLIHDKEYLQDMTAIQILSPELAHRVVIGDPASPPKYPMTIACMAWMDKLYTDIALTPTSSEADAPTFLEALIKVFRRKMVAMEAGYLSLLSLDLSSFLGQIHWAYLDESFGDVKISREKFYTPLLKDRIERLYSIISDHHDVLNAAIRLFNRQGRKCAGVFDEATALRHLKQERLHICQGDGCVKFENLKKCGRCRQVAYCSAKCQRDDWPDHKLKCVAQPESASSE